MQNITLYTRSLCNSVHTRCEDEEGKAGSHEEATRVTPDPYMRPRRLLGLSGCRAGRSGGDVPGRDSRRDTRKSRFLSGSCSG